MNTKIISPNFKKFYRAGLFTPENINLSQLLPKSELKHADKYRYLLHRLYTGKFMDKRNSSKTPINISFTHFANVVSPRRAKTIIDFWMNHGVIETDGKYQAGLFCKKYRFSDLYRKQKVSLVPFVDPKFAASLERKKHHATTTPDLTQPNMNFLHFNLNEIKMDTERAYDFTANKFKRYRVNFDKHNNYITTINSMVNNELFFKRDNKGRRLHNNFVVTAKPLRSFYYLSTGEELVNIDIKNSQLLMLAILLNQHQVQGTEQFQIDVQAGKLYEVMAKASNTTITDRKKFKQDFFKDVLYGKNEKTITTDQFKVFQKLYPSVANFVIQFKEKNHKDLSITLQRIESEIVLDTVIRDLAADYHPEHYFALTIHDSIVTTRSNVDDMVKRINNAFQPYHLTPALEIENL